MKNILAIKTVLHPKTESIDWQIAYDYSLPKIFHYFCYKVGDPILAEDLTAITFEKAWLSRRHFHSDIGQVQAWLLGIARNVAFDQFRKKDREVPLSESHERSFITSDDEKLQQKWDFEFLESILKQFPERERDLIAYKYGAELSNREIAKLTGLSESNVGTILHRVVGKLRIEWEKHHER